MHFAGDNIKEGLDTTSIILSWRSEHAFGELRDRFTKWKLLTASVKGLAAKENGKDPSKC
jgi:hypothetical protein